MDHDIDFTDEEMQIDPVLGYPKAYPKLCKMKNLSPYSYGPPFTFTPYVLQPHEAFRANQLDQLFPVIDPKARPTNKPKLFVSMLWKQLNHLGNAGFDPAILRVDNYGNVLYYHADSASPLSWDVDHWFPCSRGGLTVPSNLRILQRKVCKEKHDKLEFLVPWWDFQLGVSINQFLSLFASTNSDFRYRAFSLLFAEGEHEEVNGSQTVQSHRFPRHLKESKDQVGLAPAAIVFSRRETDSSSSSSLKAIDFNSDLRPSSSMVAAASRRMKPGSSKDNEIPLDMVTNPYRAIVMARDSLKQREEAAKIKLEVKKIDEEVNELKRKNEDEKATIQDLELTLIKRRRRVEKCRKLSESQSSYKTMLEKMIRDAMHQSVVYKEQVRLNQAATNALVARLEAQKAICDASEKNLEKRFKHKEELELQIRPEWEQERKKTRMNDTLDEEMENRSLQPRSRTRPTTLRSSTDDFLQKDRLVTHVDEEMENKSLLHSRPRTRPTTPRSSIDDPLEKKRQLISYVDEEMGQNKSLHSHPRSVANTPRSRIEDLLEQNRHQTRIHKELREFFEEEERIIKEMEEQERKERENYLGKEKPECSKSAVALDEHNSNGSRRYTTRFPVRQLPVHQEPEEDEETRQQRGKGNVEKWLKMLLENTPADSSETNKTCDIIRSINSESKRKDRALIWEKEAKFNREIARRSNASEMSGMSAKKFGSSPSFEGKRGKRGIVRSAPSSPSRVLGTRKGVDCLLKMPRVYEDDENQHPNQNNVLKPSMKMMK